MKLTHTIFVFLLIFCFNSGAQDVQFTADAPSVVEMGEQFRLTFTLNARPSSFSPPELTNFYVLSGPNQSTSTSFQIINGKTSQSITITYTYYLQATTAGTFTIEPAQAVVDRKEYFSNPLSVEVVGEQKPAPSQQDQRTPSTQPQQLPAEELFVRVLTDRKSVYQGEHIIATIKIYTRLTITGFGSSEMPDFSGFWSQDIESPTQISLQRENVNGVIYNTGVIRKVLLFPQKSGEIIIDPFKLETYIRQQISTPRSIFDDFFGPSYSNVSKMLESEPVKINVKPLPADQPTTFTGAVGSMNINASIDKSGVKTNDAITLRFAVKGNGNLKLIESPKIDFPPDFDTFDPKVTTNIQNTSNGQTGNKTFEYLLIPRHAGNYRIPPVSFSYFNPEKESYQTLQTGEFRITVEKSEEDEQVNVIPGLSKEDLKILGSDILFIKADPFKLFPAGKILFGSLPFYFVYIISLLLFIIIVLIRRAHIKKRQNIELLKNRKASKVARGKLKQAYKCLKQDHKEEFFESLLKAFWGYLSDKLSIPISELSKDTAEKNLNTYISDQELIQRFLKVIDDCEMARYSPQSGTEQMDKLYTEAVKAITKMEQNLR
ncbi:MAG: hypothetical protein AMS27_17185 [Bacteroides sp. SM23_62_1]|nr:MAG: hypothetical protein AMS27_17185 [Bacteroides sp. SM23_62_1]